MPVRCAVPQPARSTATRKRRHMASQSSGIHLRCEPRQTRIARRGPPTMTTKTLLTCALLSLAAVPALAAEPRPQDRWKLEDIYPTDAAFDADAAKVDAQPADVVKCKGKLGASGKRLRERLH